MLKLLSAIFFVAVLASAQDSLTTDSSSTTKSFGQPHIMQNLVDSPVLEVVWCGKKKEVLFLLTEKSSLYRSTDNGFSGHSLTQHLDKIGKKEVIGSSNEVGQVTRIQQNPVDENLMIFLGTEGINWITEDCGATFRALNQGRRIEEFQFHPTERNWILASAWNLCEDASDDNCRRYKELYFSKDLGNRWDLVANYVFQFSWGVADKTFTAVPKERIIIVHDPEGAGHQKLVGWNDKLSISYSDDLFKTSKVLLQGGNKFLVTSYFLFLVKVDKTDLKEVTLFVGNPKDIESPLRPIELPVKRLLEHGYTILDTSEHSVFLQINHEGEKSQYGNIYVSDSTGVRYGMSLSGNVRNSDGLCDFTRIQGVEGIYLANIYEKEDRKRFSKNDFGAFPQQQFGSMGTFDGNSNQKTSNMNPFGKKTTLDDFRKTMISFDKGGIWQTLTPPLYDSKGNRIICPTVEECSLHLHSVSNLNFGPFYSTANSMGIILGTGNVGQYLTNRPDEVNTYLSRDGGLTWFEVAKGSHTYEIGDHGSIIVMASDQKATTEVLYSWNEGLTWQTLKISDFPLEIYNIVIEPTNTGEKFMIYGRSAQNNNRGVVVAVDFEPVHQRWCQGHDKPDAPESDYETWSPNGKVSPRCLLGRQISFIRRKREAECFNSEEHEEWKFAHNCQCTEEDWECDYGYERVGNGPCLPINEKMRNQSLTPDQCSSFYYISQGYRKVAGDTCEGGINHDPLKVPCSSSWSSQKLLTIAGLLALFFGIVWLSRKENAEKIKGRASDLLTQVSNKFSKEEIKQRPEFKLIDQNPDAFKEEADDFGIIDHGEEEVAEPIIDVDDVVLNVQEKKMTGRNAIDTAKKQVPTLNKPKAKKST